jgi:hypothetical protein
MRVNPSRDTDEKKSPYERSRSAGALRSALITYGIGAFVYFFPRHELSIEGEPTSATPTGVLQTLLVGLFLQLLAFAIRKVVMRYERGRGLEGVLSPLAMYIFDLVVDGVTVLLFALATFRGIASFGSSV